MRFRVCFLCVFIWTFIAGFVSAQPPDPAQTSGSITREEQDRDQNRRLEERIKEEKPKPQVALPEEAPKKTNGQNVLVKSIRVEDAQLLSQEEIRNIVSGFEGRELSLEEMQQVADRITDAYRKKGFITSRAYIPVQSIKENVLLIRVLETKSGTVDVRGNRYFKAERLRRILNVQPGGYFDYSALQRSLVYINEHPDRKARAVLVPGKEPGTTDIVVEMAERRPFHAGFEYDNFGSRFIGRNRYSLVLEHNNLLGFDDLFYLKGQISDDSRMVLEQLRYLFPVTPLWDIGFYAVNSIVKLGKEFNSLQAEGSAQVFGLFGDYKLYKTESVDLRLNLGFDYKSVRNKLLGEQQSKDELRVFKAGFDLDFDDPLGRNIFTAGIDSGVPDILGGSEAKDPDASRVGAGGEFEKADFTFFRLQPTPWETSVLWKNIAQYSHYNLAASEQFQAGGALSVRGYPPAERSGDSGIYSALELSIPFYPLSREVRIPLAKAERLYDDLRFVLFYDIAATHLNSPLAGEKEDETLKGFGAGLRLNIKDNLTLRFEIGYPAGKAPSDGDRAHPWVEFTTKY